MTEETTTNTAINLSRNIIREGGYLIDADTGDIIEVETPRPQFVIDDLASAEWALEKMQEAAAHRAGLVARREALLSNINGMIADYDRRIDHLDHRFVPELENFARTQTSDKVRSFKTVFGTLQFRKTSGSPKVREGALEQAISWCFETGHEDAVKTVQSVLATPLKGVELPEELFEITPPGENFNIDFEGEVDDN